jgi:lipopolysaccharide export system permease protein
LLIAVIAFFVVLHYVEHVDDFYDKGAATSAVIQYYFNSIPDIIQLGSPMAVFLATIWVTGRSAQKLELSSLQTSGTSLLRLLLPFILFGSVVSVGMFFFNGWVVPETNRDKLAFERDFTKSGIRQVEYSNIHRQNEPGSVLSVGFYDRSTQTASSISLQTFDNQTRMVRRVDAVRMKWIDSTGVWELTEAVIRTFDRNGTVRRTSVASMDTTLSIRPRDLARTETDVEAMTITESRDYLDELTNSSAGKLEIPRVSYFNKFAYPVSNLILVLLAVPLSAVRRRGGQALQMGLGLFIAFVYLTIMKLIHPLGYSGTLSPIVAAWLPHAIFAVIAVIVLLRTRT